jgi:hypothetical protein
LLKVSPSPEWFVGSVAGELTFQPVAYEVGQRGIEEQEKALNRMHKETHPGFNAGSKRLKTRGENARNPRPRGRGIQYQIRRVMNFYGWVFDGEQKANMLTSFRVPPPHSQQPPQD